MLEPVREETHVTLEMGKSPQEIINKTVEQCDVMIAVFWTRIGSPTDRAESGSMEEIKAFLKADKPVLLYFSKRPYELKTPDDHDQLNRVLRFKKQQCKNSAGFREYDSLEKFETLIRNDIDRIGVELDLKSKAADEIVRPGLGLTCLVSAVPRYLRAEGVAELTGDILLNFSGGTPVSSGGALQRFNIEVELNCDSASSIDGQEFRDPPLLMGDDRTGVQSETLLSRARPGWRRSTKQLRFQDVSVGPPGSKTVRQLRVTNLRVNSCSLPSPDRVSAVISIEPTTGETADVAVASQNVAVGRPFLGCTWRVDSDLSLEEDRNEALASDANYSDAITSFTIEFIEGFRGAFKNRAQESCVTSREVTLAEHGTRLLAEFLWVPDNVQLYVTTRDIGGLRDESGSLKSPPKAVLISDARRDGSGGTGPRRGIVPLGTGAKTGAVPIARLPVDVGQGKAFAVWEWVREKYSPEYDSVIFGVVVAVKAGENPSPGVMSARGNIAPLAKGSTKSPALTRPRFIDCGSSPQDAFFFRSVRAAGAE